MRQPTQDFIAYYRVSTDRQGASGLGLDAQRQAVDLHVRIGKLIAEYTEIESRPAAYESAAAPRSHWKRRAVLLIARLDRLAREKRVGFNAGMAENTSLLCGW